VSLEVSPRLARDTDGTIAAARRLWTQVNRPNLMIKIPATREGLPAITEALGSGINVNVTLIFSVERYREVLAAYRDGIVLARRNGHDVTRLASVASFFVSRVDAAIDPLLGEGHPLLGRSAIAQVAGAYVAFLEWEASSDIQELLAHGAQIQRPLWASTSTKNPTYPALLYVDSIAVASSVNTVPDATLDIARTSGNPSISVLTADNLHHEAALLDDLAKAGVSLSEITDTLERDGVAAFVTSYEELLSTVSRSLT
jgi:transaldolase